MQLVPEAQAATRAPDSSTMSMYQGVGPTSLAAPAVSVTAVPGAADAALVASPVRQTPSAEQPPLPLAPPGVLVAGIDVLVAGTGVFVAWIGVLVGVLLAVAVLVRGGGMFVAVLVEGMAVLVTVLVAGTGVLVLVDVGVLVAGTGVLVRVDVGVLVARVRVLVGVLVAGALEDQLTETALVLGPPPARAALLVLSQAV